MHIVTDAARLARALASSLDPAIKALLELRRDQLLNDGLAISKIVNWLIVEPGDTLAATEAAAGFSFTPDPPWEWVLDHHGIFEAPIIVSDDGFGIVLIVPDIEAVEVTLIQLLRRDANSQS